MGKVVLLAAIFFFGHFVMAQNTDAQAPKIGLVLSGGGAKGLAHIGALKVIEEAGVKIDYIGGTSMGAIVGALYAAGYSATELDSIFRSTNLVDLIGDNLPRSAKTFYEKEDSERYAITLPFNNFKISAPSSLSGGQNIYNELVRMLFQVKDIKDFNKLPIPFLCIATNIETGEEVVLDSGFLPEAIMASGTLPSLFAPANIDGQLLIDGGVVNNYPAEAVKAMGADIIIGVDVQKGLRDRDALLSATEVLVQINNYRTALAMVEKVKITDVYINPEMDSFSMIDFNLVGKIIDSGELAASAKYDTLKTLSKGESKINGINNKIKPPDSIRLTSLSIAGNENYTRGYFKGKLRFEQDKKIPYSKFQQGISNLAATGNFKTIRYKLCANDVGEELILNIEENKNKSLLRLGIHYDNLYKTAALINLTKKNFLMRDDVASLDFIIGDNLRYNFQYYVDKGSYWSFGLNSRFNEFSKEVNFDLIRNNFEVPLSANINTINLEVADITNQVYVETVLREEFSFRTGLEHKFLKYSTKTLGQIEGETVVPNRPFKGGRTFFEKGNYYSAFGKLKLDTYNDKFFPSKGLYFDGDFHIYLLSSDFNDNFKEFSIGKARMGAAFPLLKNLSLNIETEGGFKFGISNVTSFDFVLGGHGTNLINNFIPFFGYDFLGLPGNSFVKAYGRLDFEFAPKNHLMFTANYANVEDDLFRTGEWFTAPNFSGYGIGYGWESFFGPIQAHYSWSPEGKTSNFFFSVGYWF